MFEATNIFTNFRVVYTNFFFRIFVKLSFSTKQYLLSLRGVTELRDEINNFQK